jgi:hypothetical protein
MIMLPGSSGMCRGSHEGCGPARCRCDCDGDDGNPGAASLVDGALESFAGVVVRRAGGDVLVTQALGRQVGLELVGHLLGPAFG